MPTSDVETVRVAESTFVGEDLAKIVRRRYSIAREGHLAALRFGVNDTYRVTSTGQRFTFRVYRANRRSADDIRWELEYLDHLAAAGVGVSTAYLTDDGMPWVELQAPEGIRRGVLMSYAPGVPIGQDAAAIRQLGCAVARMHEAARTFSTSVSRTVYDLETLLTKPLERVADIFEQRPEDWEFCTRMAETIRSAFAALPDAELPTGPLHGDIQLKNVFIAGDSITLFDFDECGTGWFAHDLAIFQLCTRGIDSSGELLKSFFAGYAEIRALSDAEQKALPLLELAHWIYVLDWQRTLPAAKGPQVPLEENFPQSWLDHLRNSELTRQLGLGAQKDGSSRTTQPGAQPDVALPRGLA